MVSPSVLESIAKQLVSEVSEFLIWNASENGNKPLQVDFITKMVLGGFYKIEPKDIQSFHIELIETVLGNLIKSKFIVNENNKFRLSNGVMSFTESNFFKKGQAYAQQLYNDLIDEKIDLETFRTKAKELVKSQQPNYDMYV